MPAEYKKKKTKQQQQQQKFKQMWNQPGTENHLAVTKMKLLKTDPKPVERDELWNLHLLHSAQILWMPYNLRTCELGKAERWGAGE